MEYRRQISKFISEKNIFILYISTIQLVIIFIVSSLHYPIYSFCLPQPTHTLSLNFQPNPAVSVSFPPIPTLHISSCQIYHAFPHSCPANSHSSTFPHPITCSFSFHIMSKKVLYPNL